jgi:tRNA-specific 2-thiouridylase
VIKKGARVLIGLSGGVDSAVAAYLLKKAGYQVVGGFMRNWDAMANNDILGNPTISDQQCPQESDYDDAKAVADKLGIELLRVDFIEEYWNDVFAYFLSEYEKGRTPNPDIFCNKYIKFDAFLNFAKKNGFDFIAMGHYAKRKDCDNVTFLLKAEDINKDQSYFLSQISQQQVASCLFPLGNISKPQVRTIAHELNLKSVMDKKDSTGVCFIGERRFKEFLMNYLPAKKGDIIDINTRKKIGTHDGVLYYTIGQRKGLGIGGISGQDAIGWTVVGKDVKKNYLLVASGSNDEHLFSDYCLVRNLNWISGTPTEEKTYGAKFRYRQPDQNVKLSFIDSNTVKVIYSSPVKAVTPGQAAVFYDGDICLGGGIIDEVYRDGKRVL